MKIALLRVMPEENWVSMGVYADSLARALRALNTSNQITEVQVRAWSWPDQRLRMPYGRPASLQTLGLYLSRWIRYPLALGQTEADVYHILDNSYGHLAFFLSTHKTVVTLHGGTPRTRRQWSPEGPAMKVFDAAFRGMLRAGRIICVSEHAKRELLAEADYPPDRIAVIHHGVDPAFQPIPRTESQGLREKLLQPGERYLLLHVGHSEPRKNVETLYRVVASLRQKGWTVRLVRIGRPPTAAQAELIEDLGIAPFITHLSTLPNQELPAYYAAADVFVFPSLYEGFGLPLIEAMACATPVVCSDWELFHEVCYDAAVYADPRSPEAFARAITDVLDNQTLAVDIRERALSRARKFTWDRAAQQVLDVYNSLYENRHASQRI